MLDRNPRYGCDQPELLNTTSVVIADDMGSPLRTMYGKYRRAVVSPFADLLSWLRQFHQSNGRVQAQALCQGRVGVNYGKRHSVSRENAADGVG
jgi:hypothetical protein